MWASVLVVLPLLFNSIAAQGNLGPCDPLVPEICYLPWPNNFWLRRDDTSVSGFRVNVPSETVPRDRQNQTFDTSAWNTFDGFHSSPSIQTFFEDLDVSLLPPHWDIALSLQENSQSLLVDYDATQRLPHFAELDFSTPDTINQTLLLWPDRRLQDNRRYIVAFRGLTTNRGEPIQPSPVFKALRDRTASSDPTVEPRRAAFEEIFAKLEQVGVRRADLVLAWDFSTASTESVTGRMVAARDDATARVGPDGPTYRITLQEDDYSTYIYRKIEGEMLVPSYMDSPNPGSSLVLDEKGLPVYQGMQEFRFTVLIPRSAVEARRPVPILQYGHGLLGGQGEVTVEYLQQIANNNGYIICAADWVGMATPDAVTIVLMMLTDLGRFNMIPDRSTQGMTNMQMLTKLMIGRFSRDPLVTFDGVSLIDTTRRYYYGNSQGGILGLPLMALSQDIDYGCLGVSGAPYGLLLTRSSDFDSYFTILKGRYLDAQDRIWLVSAFLPFLWDRAEPSGYLNVVTKDPLSNTKPKRLLMQYGLGDAQVSWLALYFKTRSVGAKFFQNNVLEFNETLYGIEYTSTSSVTEGSISVGYSYGAPPAPRTNTPPDKTYDTHEKPRRDSRAIEQMDQFFKTGAIVDICGGLGCYSANKL